MIRQMMMLLPVVIIGTLELAHGEDGWIVGVGGAHFDAETKNYSFVIDACSTTAKCKIRADVTNQRMTHIYYAKCLDNCPTKVNNPQ